MNSILHPGLRRSNKRRPKLSTFVLLALMLMYGVLALAQTTTRFNDGYITVLKVSSGAALTNTGTALVADEFLPATAAQSSPNYTFNVPVTGSTRAVISGSASSSGAMTRSENGRYLVIPGYDNAVGDANSGFLTSVMRLLNGSGTIGAGIQGSFYTTANDFRGAASDDGSNFWTSGGSTGIRYSNNGTTVTTVSTTSTNTRGVNIFNGQLFYSTGSGTNGIYKVGSGKPTASGTTSVLQAASTAPYGFSVSPDGLTIYAFASANIIARFTYSGTYNAATFTYSGGSWSAASSGFTLNAATGVAVDWNNYSFSTGANGARIFACNPTTLVAGNDNGTAAITTTVLRTATTNTAFRGLAFSPVKQTVSLGSSSPAGNLTQGSNNAVVFQFAVSADEGNSTIKKLILAQNGSATLGAGNSLDNFRLVYDADSNGSASAGEISASLATGTISGSNITFTGISQAFINQGSVQNYLVIANVSGSGTGTFIPSIASNKTLNSVNYTTNLVNAGGSFVNIGASAPTGNTLTISAATVATIGTSGTLSAVNTTYGTASATTQFTVTGSNLTNNILISAPSGFEISQTAGGASGFAPTQTLVQSGGNVGATTIYVRLAATTVFGNYSGDITLTSSPAAPQAVATVASSVAKKGLTVSGAIANNKIYDRNTAATISGATASGTVNGDAIVISGGGTFSSFLVGTGISVTPALTFSGTNSGSYTLTQPSNLSANITPKALTLSGASAASKIYDGNTDASISGTLAGVISPDDVSVILTGSFDSPGVDTGIAVTSSSTLSGADAANYILTQPAGLTADITPKALTIVGATAQNKVYDGTTDAQVTGTLSGVIAPDDVTLIGTGTFASPNVGTNIPVTSTSTIVGDIANYTLIQPTGLTANISPGALQSQTITFNALSDVTYGDAPFALTATASSGLTVSYSSDNTSVAVVSGNTVTIVGVGSATITASQSGDLTYDSAEPVSQVLTVLQKALTISGATASDKVYDGTDAATFTGTLSGIVGSDDVAFTGNGNFTSVNAGTNIPVIANAALSGTDSANYTLTQPAGLSADITPKALTATATANNKVYDGNTVASISNVILSGIVGSDDVTASGSGAFASEDVANNISVTASLILGGASASNYSLIQPSGLSANITPLTATISGVTGANKVYDRTTAATLSGTPIVSNAVAGDAVSVSGTPTATFNNKNVGIAKPITVTGYTLAGADAGNYTISQPTGVTGDITQASVTIAGAVAQNKPFDGTTAATITGTLSGVITGDVVTLIGTGNFASSAVGNGIAVTSTSTLGGADGINYVISPQPSGLTANITPGPTVFAAGDLSIIGFNLNAPDNFAFVTWVDILNGTIIKFTDNGFLSSGSANAANNARGGENFVIWKNNGATIPAGTVITIQDNNVATAITNNGTIVSGVLNGLSASGDNIFAYQGAATSGTAPDFTNNNNPTTFNGTVLFGLYAQGSSAVSSWITTGTASSNSSYLPSQLNFATGNIALGSSAARGQYTGSRSNQANLNNYKALVTNPANWTTGAGAGIATLNTTSFTLATPPTASVISGSATICNGTSTNISVAITGGTSPYTVVYTDGTSNFTVNSYISGASISVSPAVSTTYTLVSVTDANSLAGTGNSGSATITVNQLYPFYADADGDTYGAGAIVNVCSTDANTVPAGYSLNNTDCNDSNAAAYQSATLYIDADSDGYNNGSSVQCYGATLPAGYSATTNGTDCNDANASVYQNGTFYVDADNDGYNNGGAPTVVCYGATTPSGYTLNTGVDCNDSVAAINPGHAEVLYNGVDDNCNGQLDEGNQIRTKLLPESCGSTLASINSLIGITTVSSQITGYRIRVTNGANVQIIERNVPHFTLTELASYAYATTYTVEIELQRLGVWLGYYGDSCLVSSPPVLSAGGATQVSPSQCGMTLPRINTLIATTSLQGVTGYRFRVTNLTTTTGANVVQVLDRPINWFSLQMLAQYNYGTTYQVEIAIKTTGAFGGYGAVCNIISPAAPSLINCGGTVAASSTLVAATSLNGVMQYRFQIQRDSDGATTTIDRNANYFTFNMIPGYTPNALYNIRVAVMTTGTWSPLGEACQITSPASASRQIAQAEVESVVNTAFTAVAYPNPFIADFKLDVTSTSGKVEVSVYDLTGRLIESRQSQSASDDFVMGSQYPAGVYNVIAKEGDKIKTLRVIKR